MSSAELSYITPEFFRQAIDQFNRYLIANEQVINELNLYPVPDSDTGTNSLVTLHSGIQNMTGDSISELANSLATGSAKSALGNSGVILSAYLTGLAKDLKNQVGLEQWQLALNNASTFARQAVLHPNQGTILSVAEAVAKVKCDGLEVAIIKNSIVARRALAKTTDSLPVLKRADVVDSGAVVLTLFHDAFAKLILNNEFTALVITKPDCIIFPDYNGPASELMFDVRLFKDEKTELIQKLSTLGESISIISSESSSKPSKMRVHMHTDNPDEVLNATKVFGEVSEKNLFNLKLNTS